MNPALTVQLNSNEPEIFICLAGWVQFHFKLQIIFFVIDLFEKRFLCKRGFTTQKLSEPQLSNRIKLES